MHYNSQAGYTFLKLIFMKINLQLIGMTMEINMVGQS